MSLLADLTLHGGVPPPLLVEQLVAERAEFLYEAHRATISVHPVARYAAVPERLLVKMRITPGRF